MEPTSYVGPICVTAAYFLFWYVLLFVVQRGAKYRLQARYKSEGKVFDRYFGQDAEMLAVDRVVGNTLEQMGPFLASFWLYAVFVSPRVATVLGSAYIVLRALYPVLLGRRLSKMQSKRVYVVTIPSYAIVLGMFGMTVAAALG